MSTRPLYNRLRILAAALIAAAAPAGAALAADHAVAFVYHRFGESAYPSTNTSVEQLSAQIAYLKDGGFTVTPLKQIVAAIRAGAPLPDKTVAISIDDAHLSVARVGLPMLKAAGMTATLFVSTAALDGGRPGAMDWDDLRQAIADGFDVGAHTADHVHMAETPPDEARRQIETSNRRFREELGFTPELFAYPYGEASLAVREIVREAGYVAAFGQHSGVLHASEDPFYLPRFALNEKYGALARFRTLAGAKSLLAQDVTPRDMTLGPDTNPPAFGFTIDPAAGDIAALACYASGVGRLRLQTLGGRRIEARLPRRLDPGRHRINCTLPAGGGRWRWFGRQFFVPSAAG